MDKKISDDKIAKALECCAKDNVCCRECPLRNDYFCRVSIIRFSYELVKRMETRSTQLTTFLIDYKNAYEKVKSKNTDLISENTQLTARIEELQRRIVFWREDINYNPGKIRAEAKKELAEQIIVYLDESAEGVKGTPMFVSIFRQMKEAVKEMAGDIE